MQTQGSLQESGLASLLQTMQSERATGTLTLEDGSDSCSMFFLFGHLFHAVSPAGDGEEVVVRALSWQEGNFHFDPRAKLPAEETIKSSPAELIAAAEDAGEPAAVAAAAGSASSASAPSLRAIEGQSGATAAAAEPSIWSPAASVPETGADAATPWVAPAAPESAESSGGDAWTPGSRTADTAPVYTPAEYSPTYVPAEPAPVAAVATPPSRSGGDSKPSNARSRTAGGALETQPVGALPIPSGH
ncbi:MAG: DUF4388 domain-containing protein, partial [Candidatus Dormibacteraeota bacterium]|nr:DUF4388 domain-containing protein [Candidatus Dormibacteraeota bacterium]